MKGQLIINAWRMCIKSKWVCELLLHTDLKQQLITYNLLEDCYIFKQ